MTLDEAIVHAREVAERNRNQYKNCPSDRTDIRHQTCEECEEEHEQLAEWLEELKKYREIGTVEECRVAAEKKKAKKPIEMKPTDKLLNGYFVCPICGGLVGMDEYSNKYCGCCGQKLDWGDEE